MKKYIKLLRKKLIKRLSKLKTNKYAKAAKQYEHKMAIKYNCNIGLIQEHLNNYEKICYNKLVNKWIDEDIKNTKLIKKYIGITKKSDILYSSINEL